MSGNFILDVVVSVVTPQITSSPGKLKLNDEKNNNHLFFHNSKRVENPQTREVTNLLQRPVAKNIRKNSTAKNEKTQAKQLTLVFDTKIENKETFASFTKLNPFNKLI